MQFTFAEYKELDGWLLECGVERKGCPVFWRTMRPFGRYVPAPERIDISDITRGQIKLITPCVVHELTHRDQRRRAGSLLAYYAGLTLMRYWWEKEAVKAERAAERTLGIDLG